MIDAASLLEWAEVFGHRSGTPRRPVETASTAGRDVVLEIDVQGARQVRDRVPDAVLILLAPPSLEELKRRLRARGTEDEAELAERLAAAERELEQAPWFDHVVVNDELERASARSLLSSRRRTPADLRESRLQESMHDDRTQDRRPARAVDSKYTLVILAAKRAREINSYYSQLGEGRGEFVPPLVETGLRNKPLSIALEEIAEGKITDERPEEIVEVD